MAAVVLGLVSLCVAHVVRSAPVSTYDQRQQGELNIHAQLDNIVIVLIPTSNFNLLEFAGKTKYSAEKPGSVDKGGFLQLFQKSHKSGIDRYETVKEEPEVIPPIEPQNDIKMELVVPAITSQQVVLNHEEKKGENEEKEEEVVATVEEMKPDIATDSPKSEVTEDISKAHSTVSETVQESVLKVSIPQELKDDVKAAEEEIKSTVTVKSSEEDYDKEPRNPSEPEKNLDSIKNPGKESSESLNTLQKQESSPHELDKSQDEGKLEVVSTSETNEPTIEDLIRPVAAKEEETISSVNPKKTPMSVETSPLVSKKTPISAETSPPIPKKTSMIAEPSPPVFKKTPMTEEPSLPVSKKTPVSSEPSSLVSKKTPNSDGPVRLVEGSRKEKVIRYKPETKWAPGLVDLLGPSKPRELEERQRFASLCSPGVWDTELKTCIMPGETRSRSELARFLEAMRFGIAVPAQ